MHSSPTPSPQASNAWRVLFLLFLANLFNFFDRTIPAIIIEPIRMEWHLSDFQLGIIGTAFTLVYAIAGLPLGRMADNGSRKKIMGWGLAVWSGLTAINGLAGSFWTFLLVRMGVGIGEASYAPAANSLIGDLFPAHRRARAMGIFMLGLPLGLLLAFFTMTFWPVTKVVSEKSTCASRSLLCVSDAASTSTWPCCSSGRCARPRPAA